MKLFGVSDPPACPTYSLLTDDASASAFRCPLQPGTTFNKSFHNHTAAFQAGKLSNNKFSLLHYFFPSGVAFTLKVRKVLCCYEVGDCVYYLCLLWLGEVRLGLGKVMARQEDALASEYQVLEELGSKSLNRLLSTYPSSLASPLWKREISIRN